uniref:Uncharacterized protein n=1 Tax=Oncorhynchus tshawytscha TaxID=74940 RepID=A0AAZ3RV58_ONCTS
MILMPLPLQATHFCTAPALPPEAHRTFLLSCSLVVLPLVTVTHLRGCTISSPLLRPPLRPPPPRPCPP